MSKITLQAQLKSVEFKIDDGIIGHNDLIDYELTRDNSTLYSYGFISFKDTTDYITTIIDGTQFLNVDVVDVHNNVFHHKFIITQVNFNTDDIGNKVANLSFMDEFSFHVHNKYISKSFKDKTLAEMFEDIVNNEGLSDYLDGRTLNITTKGYKHTEYVIPQHLSLHDFLEIELSKNGFTWYSTSTEIVIKHESELIPSLLDEVDTVYMHKPPNKLYKNLIIDFSVGGYNTQGINKIFATEKSLYFDDSTKTIINYDKKLEDSLKEVKLTDKDMAIDYVDGEKYNVSLYNNTDDINFRFLNNNKNVSVEVFVPGNFEQTKVNTVVELELRGSPHYKDGVDKGDVTYSGKYVINKITDKIMGGSYFYQLVTLSRSGINEYK